MKGMTDIDILKSKNVKERDIEMFKLRMEGMSYKDIAAKFKLKSGVSVSRRIKKIQEILKNIDQGIKSGDIVLQNSGVERGTQVATSSGTIAGLKLPDNNPFLALNTFQDLAGISSAGGAVIGAGMATLVQGFQRDDLKYEDRQMMVMKGGSVIASSLLALWLTFNKFSSESQKEPNIKEVDHVD